MRVKIDGLVLMGCGNMGFAMLRDWLGRGVVTSDRIVVVEPIEALRERAAELGVLTVSNVADLDDGFSTGIIFIAVKPQGHEACLASSQAVC